LSLRCAKVKLVLRLLGRVGAKALAPVLEEMPEAKARSCLFKLHDPPGECIFWLGFRGGELAVEDVEDLGRAPFATTEVSMHVDTLARILDGELDFRAAYLYDLVDVKANDGMPSTYHFLLWAAFFDKAVELLKKR